MRIDVIITTKDRWRDLLRTLDNLTAVRGYVERVLIVDDGSQIKAPPEVLGHALPVVLRREQKSLGLITRRNELMRDARTDWVLSLDDDVELISDNASFDEVLQSRSREESVSCITFPLQTLAGSWQVAPASTAEDKTPTRAFLGGAHLMKRSAFAIAGGYRSELFQTGEEIDLATRMMKKGDRCVRANKCVWLHRVSPVARSMFVRDYYGIRNRMFWYWRYAPTNGVRAYRIMGLCARAVQTEVVQRRRGSVAGAAAGLAACLSNRIVKEPLTLREYETWKGLPIM